MSRDDRASIIDGKDGDVDDHVDVWWFPERKIVPHRTCEDV